LREKSFPLVVLLTSCDAEATAGLEDLVEKRRVSIVAPSAGLGQIKKRFPSTEVTAAEEWAKTAPFEVRVIPLKDPKTSPVAYVVRRKNKTVLISGRYPTKIDEEYLAKAAASPPESRDEIMDRLMSINRLEDVKPDLWLPSVPWHGQNANLYDTEWADLIANNYRAEYDKLRRISASPPSGESSKPAR